MRFLREMTWKQHMSVFKPARSYLNPGSWIVTVVLYHRELTNTQIILARCLGCADLKSCSGAALCGHVTGLSVLCCCAESLSKMVLSLNNHTHLPAGETSWNMRAQMLTNFSLTWFTSLLLGCWNSGLVKERSTCCEGSHSTFDLSPVVWIDLFPRSHGDQRVSCMQTMPSHPCCWTKP